MAKFDIVTAERHWCHCWYNDVEADTEEEAIELVRAGRVAYDDKEYFEADNPFTEVEEILEVDQVEL